MSIVTIFRGVPGSFKTTEALRLANASPSDVVRVNRDDIRMMLFGAYWFDGDDASVKEKAVTEVEHSLIKSGIKANKNVIVDATNLNKQSVKSILRISGSHGADVEFRDFEVSYDDAQSIDKVRDKSVGSDVVDRFFKRNSIPKDTGKLPEAPAVPTLDYSEFIPYDASQGVLGNPVVLVDIDGTVAHMDGRSPYDYSRVSEDKPDYHVAELVKTLYHDGLEIIFLSGRKASCYDDTLSWLYELFQGDIKFSLIMRETDDDRPDYIVKYELFQKYINRQRQVALVIDDRLQVCRMWHRLGLKVFRVGDPDADF